MKDYREVIAHISLIVHGQRAEFIAPPSPRISGFSPSKHRQSKQVRHFVKAIAPAIREIPIKIHRANPRLPPTRSRTASPSRIAPNLAQLLPLLIIALSSLGLALYFHQAPTTKAKSDLSEIRSALELLYAGYGQFPSSGQGLRSIQYLGAPSIAARNISLLDPWGRPYGYQVGEGGQSCTVWTYGADGKPGGDGKNQDLSFVLIRP